jgi:hypothetical protein
MPAGGPLWLSVNEHACALAPSRPSVFAADCVPEGVPTEPPSGARETGTNHGPSGLHLPVDGLSGRVRQLWNVKTDGN